MSWIARRIAASASAATVMLLIAAPALGQRVTVPLVLEPPFLELLLREQVFTGTGGSLSLNDDGTGCQYLILREPKIEADDGRVRLVTSAEARAGRPVGDRCLLGLDWQGEIELDQVPSVAEDGAAVVLDTESWRARRPDGSTAPLANTLGQWLERFLPPELRRTRIGFEAPLGSLAAYLDGLSPAGAVPVEDVAIDAVAAADGVVTLTLGMTATEPAPPATAAPAEPAPSAAELARLEQRLDDLDAFFTYAARTLAPAAAGEEVPALLEALLALRHDVVDALAATDPQAGDPARRLFVSAWERLSPVVRSLALRQPDGAAALQYLTFIGAGDALEALDALGPGLGIDISADGLRRLARLLAPDDGSDPLLHDEAADPELRRLLGFGPPLPPPEPGADPGASLLDWLVSKAVAAEALDPALVKRLNNWVPRTADMDVYLPMVRQVLRHAVTSQLGAGELDRRFASVYRALVFAAAWQESCWRQFTAENDMRVPVQSGTGDVGMMQINPTVWRGFYDLHGLRWDIVYNARAGADILHHHLINYALRHREHEVTGSADSLARATYAAYNGGPAQYARYRRSDASEHGRKVDALFYDKYRQVSGGRELAVTACYGGAG